MTRKKKEYVHQCHCGLLIANENNERCNDCEETYQLKLDAEWVRATRLKHEKMERLLDAITIHRKDNKDG